MAEIERLMGKSWIGAKKKIAPWAPAGRFKSASRGGGLGEAEHCRLWRAAGAPNASPGVRRPSRIEITDKGDSKAIGSVGFHYTAGWRGAGEVQRGACPVGGQQRGWLGLAGPPDGRYFGDWQTRGWGGSPAYATQGTGN
eukprot:EG_transcript_18123